MPCGRASSGDLDNVSATQADTGACDGSADYRNRGTNLKNECLANV